MNSVPKENQDNKKTARFIGAKRTPLDRGHQRSKRLRLKDFAYTVLLLMAIAAILILRKDVSNYISSFKSMAGLKLAITDLIVTDDANSQTFIRFKVKNESPLKIELQRYSFVLYHNGATVGRSYSMYQGTDPNINPMAYPNALEINRVLNPGKTLSLEFTLYIYPTKMKIIRQAPLSEPATWQVRSNFTVSMPYSQKIFHAKLKAEYEG